MFRLKTIISGAERIVNGLRNARKANEKTHKIIGDLTEQAAEAMRRDAPQKSRRLARSIMVRAVGEMKWEVRSDVPYLWIQALGTSKKNYPIYPRHPKDALSWVGLDHPIAAVHNHPGIKGKNFVRVGISLAERGVSNASKLIQQGYRDFILGGG